MMPLTRRIDASEFRSGEHGQAFKDGLLVVAFAVEESPARLGHDFLTGGALPALAAFAREAELAQVAGIDSAVICAFRIPAKGI